MENDSIVLHKPCTINQYDLAKLRASVLDVHCIVIIDTAGLGCVLLLYWGIIVCPHHKYKKVVQYGGDMHEADMATWIVTPRHWS